MRWRSYLRSLRTRYAAGIRTKDLDGNVSRMRSTHPGFPLAIALLVGILLVLLGPLVAVFSPSMVHKGIWTKQGGPFVQGGDSYSAWYHGALISFHVQEIDDATWMSLAAAKGQVSVVQRVTWSFGWPWTQGTVTQEATSDGAHRNLCGVEIDSRRLLLSGSYPRLAWLGAVGNALAYAAGLWVAWVGWKSVCVSRRRRPGQCQACCYDLTGSSGLRCPECGTTHAVPRPSPEPQRTQPASVDGSLRDDARLKG